jgi:predicted Zn-dependent protease
VAFQGDTACEHLFRAAQGWFELGLPAEADRELAALPDTWRGAPEVLKLRFHVARARKRHEAAGEVAEELIQKSPKELWGWLYRSQARHWLGKSGEAFTLLLPMQKSWPKAFEIPYDLACYCAQTGRLDEARLWYRKALTLTKNPGGVRAMALEDPDLRPLWDEIRAGAED